jgi:hypothetical protein
MHTGRVTRYLDKMPLLRDAGRLPVLNSTSFLERRFGTASVLQTIFGLQAQRGVQQPGNPGLLTRAWPSQASTTFHNRLSAELAVKIAMKSEIVNRPNVNVRT